MYSALVYQCCYWVAHFHAYLIQFTGNHLHHLHFVLSWCAAYICENTIDTYVAVLNGSWLSKLVYTPLSTVCALVCNFE